MKTWLTALMLCLGVQLSASAAQLVIGLGAEVTTVDPHVLNAASTDFDSGKAALGTGPYRIVRFAKGERIELARHDAYYGPKPAWERVVFRLISNDAARAAAARGDRDRDRRAGDGAAALPGQHVGHAQGLRLHAAHRRADLRPRSAARAGDEVTK
jgi:MarR-like DNA-binding transcriptional regulator SgrR of sgrS sRNA